MYLQHFGLQTAPFKITPHTEVFFKGAHRGAILEALVYAIAQGEGLIKVTGEVGSGKTMLCRVLAERLPPSIDTIYLAIPSLKRDEILLALAQDLGLHDLASDGGTTSLLRQLQGRLIERHGEGRQVVVLIDEAHAMPLESLEEIRLLSNLETNQSKLLQIVLFGQPELDAHLALPQMRQLKERITHSFALAPLQQADVADYLRFRLRSAGYRGGDLFEPAGMRLIANASMGLTRRINILADKALLSAFAANSTLVRLAHVRTAINDSDFARMRRPRTLLRRAALVGAGAALGVAGLTSVQSVLDGASDPPVPALVVRSARAPVQSPSSTAPVDSIAAADAADASLRALIGAPPAAGTAARAAPTIEHSAGQSIAAGAVSEAPAERVTVPNAAAGGAVHQQDPAPLPSSSPSESTGAASSIKPAEPTALQLGRAWVLAQAEDAWVIQMLLVRSGQDAALRGFIDHAGKALGAEQLHQYPLQVKGEVKVGVVYGAFATRREADRALANLPRPLKQAKPYLRTIGVLRQEIAP